MFRILLIFAFVYFNVAVFLALSQVVVHLRTNRLSIRFNPQIVILPIFALLHSPQCDSCKILIAYLALYLLQPDPFFFRNF